MSRTYQTQYQALNSLADELEIEEQEAPPCDNIVIQTARDHQNHSRWNHVKDLDDFFTRIYHYVQRKGFCCMAFGDFFLLLVIVFVVALTTFMAKFVDYPTLWYDKANMTGRVHFSDAVIPWHEVKFGVITYIFLLFAFLHIFQRSVKVVLNLFKYWEMKAFFNYELNISEPDLLNKTWHEVQSRLIIVQRKLHMCIHKSELTQLDVYHRILRFKNYMISMVNKSLLPIKFKVPILGDYVFFTSGLKYNFEMILFSRGPWAPFENNWHLKSEFMNLQKRKDLELQISRRILLFGIGNLILSPIIFVWSLLFIFFEYFALFKTDPAQASSRHWTEYARHFLRHFNEMDHEFNARLSRGYRPAQKYMNLFSSPILTVMAHPVLFVSGSFFGVLCLLTYVDLEILGVQEIVRTLFILTIVFGLSRSWIPDENMVINPEALMTAVLCQVHYMPDSWKGQAHTTQVKNEFSHLFQYRAVFLLEELLSPIVTPFILIFWLRPKSLEIVDFFRNYTVNVEGVGDVCSFAQMDIRRHGHPEWTSKVKVETPRNQNQRAEFGKTELSLMHFTLTNPEWRVPDAEVEFINTIRLNVNNTVKKDFTMMGIAPMDNPLLTSSQSLSMIGQQYSSLTLSAIPRSQYASATNESTTGSKHPMAGESLLMLQEPGTLPPLSMIGGGAERNLDYPIGSNVQSNFQQPFSYPTPTGGYRRAYDEGMLEHLTNEMSFSALYLFEHHRQRRMLQNAEIDTDERERQLWQTTEAGSLLSGPTSRMPNIQEEEDTLNRRTGTSEADYLLNISTTTEDRT